MQRTLLLALLLASCKDEPAQPVNCNGPDFDVIITALDAPLPADTVVHVAYGGGEDEYRLVGDDGKDHVLFCRPSDRDGNPVSGEGGQSGLGPDDGGAGGAPSSTTEGLYCELWTDGPATVTVETAMYPVHDVPLSGKKGKCTVSAEIEIGSDDGGA